MKKNLFRYSLMAALACGLSMGFVACSDDDKSDNNGSTDSEVMNAEQTDEAVRAWSWISVLTDETDQAANWASKIYTATIGQESSNNPTARLIYVNDLDDAKASFANIVGCNPEELNGKKTISAGTYGSMTWNVSDQGASNIATVEVYSSLLPDLQQIIFCTEDQAPENASFITGNCYYRLGDVVEDQDGYYWVCVQPSFFGKKNNDSYWVNVFNADDNGKGVNTGKLPGIPQKNIYSKYNKKYNGNTILLPTGLKMDRKQNYNFANLVWALLIPEKYKKIVGKFDDRLGIAGLPAKFHGPTFVQNVRDDWEKQGIFQKVFHMDVNKLQGLEHLNLFYYGYHWKVGSTAGVWIYHTLKYELKFFGSLDDDDKLFEMKKAGYGFDIRRYAADANQDRNCAAEGLDGMAPAVQFDEDGNGYWIVRVATGRQLDTNKKYNPYQPINGVYNISNYNNRNKVAVGEGTYLPDTELDFDDDDDDDDDDGYEIDDQEY